MNHFHFSIFLLVLSLSLSAWGQKRGTSAPAPPSFKFSKPLSAKEAHTDVMSKKSVRLSTVEEDEMPQENALSDSPPTQEEEYGGAQTRVVRRVVPVSNMVNGENGKYGSTKKPGYNPNLKNKTAAPQPNAAGAARMKLQPSKGK